jgi:hypothetical protein
LDFLCLCRSLRHEEPVEADGYSLVLDFATNTREAAAPRPKLNVPWWTTLRLGLLGF